jgi:two-component system, OmpR family, sensor histidine kinase CreC
VTSLRRRLFLALSGAALVGAFATGLFAVLVDPAAIGFAARVLSVAPKAVLLALGMVPPLLLAAHSLGKTLARPVEDVSDAALRIAQGDAPSPRGFHGVEARRIGLALASLRREVERQPRAAASLRDACHDLKNPLAALRASLEILEEGGLSTEEATRFLASASRATRELERQLDARFTLARFESAALRPASSVSVQRLVEEAIREARPFADAQGVRLETALKGPSARGQSLLCDPTAVGRALTNLVHNACAATPRGAVSIVCDDRAPDSVVVDVLNEPAAVPRESRDRLFARGASPRGTGLGLAIARAAVEAHGGKLTFVEWGPPRVRVRVELPRR